MKALPYPQLMALCGAVVVLVSCDGSDSSTGADGKLEGGYAKANYGIPWDTSFAYGTVTDSRDNQMYRTITIGTTTWMAENLNFGGAGVCPGSSGSSTQGTADSCMKYGRLYTWAEVMQGSGSSSASPSGVKGICPTGWHVPSDADWDSLVNTDGNKLKAKAGWLTNTGTDQSGFRALPAGVHRSSGAFKDAGLSGYWWTATESSETYAVIRQINDNQATFYMNRDYKEDGLSLRCIQSK